MSRDKTTDPRIEIAARALRQIEHMLGVALSDAEHGSGPDHDPGQIMCDAMGDARELAFEAYRATLDATQPEVEVYAMRLIDEMLAAQSRFAAAWCDDTELSPSQLRDEQIRDEARRKLLNMAARPEVEIYGTFGDGSRQVIRTGANSVTITSETAGDIILELQDALTAARAPADPDRRAERQARIEAAISACTECGGREFPKRSDCDGCTAAVDDAMEEERSAPAAPDQKALLPVTEAMTDLDQVLEIIARWEYGRDKDREWLRVVAGALAEKIAALRALAVPDAWQPIETAPRDGTSILACHWKNGVRALVYFNRFKEWESVAINNMPTGVGFYPTHWISLPKPPFDAAKDAKP